MSIDKGLKNEIFKSYLNTFVLRKADSANKETRIAGFHVFFCGYESLSILFEEIFINHVYFFTAENSHPYIIDCGSNIGMSVLFFKMHYPEASILAFEPNDAAFACLQKNVRVNNLQGVEIIKKALSDEEGEVKFFYDQENPGELWASTLQARMPKDDCVVEATVLSKYMNREIDFLKMDIEGAEMVVITELSKAKVLPYIKQMVIEYHHHVSQEDDSILQIIKILEDEGFGYQIAGALSRPFKARQYQDILIYAYPKGQRPRNR